MHSEPANRDCDKGQTDTCRYLGILIIFFILACEFYLSISPFGEKGSAKTFFANYLGAPLFIVDLIAYKVSRKSFRDFSC